MKSDQEKKLSILRRRQKGKLLIGNLINAFKQKLSYEINKDSFLSLDLTQQLRQEFFSKVKALKGNYDFPTEGSLLEFLIKLANGVGSSSGQDVFFHQNDQYTGALKLRREFALKNADKLWAIANEDFCIASIDLSSGLCVERNFYDLAGNYYQNGIIELTSWGEFETHGGTKVRGREP